MLSVPHPLKTVSVALVLLLASAPCVRALVISEIHYNAPDDEKALEFIEITNEDSSVIEISGYAFVEGIRYTFPPGTLLLGGESLVVCEDVDAVRSAYGIENAVGNYDGRLDGSGERVTLVNHVGIPIASLRYDDDGKWPVAPDGTGHSLVLRSLTEDFTEPESWTASPELGGSPGRPEPRHAELLEVEEREIIPAEAAWQYRKGSAPFSDPPRAWVDPAFDDSAWASGAAGFGYEDDDDTTVLDDMKGQYTTVAIRREFELDEGDLEGDVGFVLAVSYDDGFCAFVNGTAVVFENCPEDAGHDAVAPRSREAHKEERFTISRRHFRAGRNVVALLAVNRSLNDSDMSIHPRLLHVRSAAESSEALPISFNELYRGDEKSTAWLELFNRDTREFDLSGLSLSDDPEQPQKYVFAPQTRLPPRGFLVLDESTTSLQLSEPRVRLFLFDPSGHVLTATVFDEEPPPEAGFATYSEILYPDGGRPGWITTTPSAGAENRVERIRDIVINEIYYHPPEERPGEFIELYHRGLERRATAGEPAAAEPVDLSGFRFTRGITYTFPQGITLDPGAYLVVAKDPEVLRERAGFAAALGPYEGQLSNSGERLRLVDGSGNLVDEVRYYEGGHWSAWADGGGASLELSDPLEDNDLAAAWEASDESEKSSWEELTLEVPEYVPGGDSEVHLLLLQRGVCHIDELQLVRTGETENLIPNGNFEDDTSPWRIEGTHILSQRTTSDSYDGGACLELAASGKGDSRCNRLETDTTTPWTAGSYRFSMWARWLLGGNSVIVHGDFAEGPRGPLSTNSMAARFDLTVPWNLGTPGEENTARQRLRELGGDNLGPAVFDVQHRQPASDALPVKVRASARDVAGVTSVHVVYREDAQDTPFVSTELFDDGSHEDGIAGDGIYGGTVDARFASGTTVRFYVEATDSLGEVGRFPRNAPERTCLFVTGPPRDARFQLLLDESQDRELRRRRLHSNHLLDATVIFENDEIYYNTGMRYRGSPWGRRGKEGFRVRFGEDRLFLGRKRDINITNRDREDGLGYYFMSRSGTPEVPVAVADYSYLSANILGRRFATMGVFEPYDRRSIRKWFGSEVADDGVLLKADGRMRFNDGCDLESIDIATLTHMGEHAENYRFYWFHKLNQARDRWEPFQELTRIMDPATTPGEDFDASVDSVLFDESFLRVLGMRILMNDSDSLFITAGHNGYLLWDPRNGLWTQLPFDMGHSFDSPPKDELLNIAEPRVARYLRLPRVRRRYYQLLHEFVQGYWSLDRAGPFLDALAQSSGVGSGRSHVSATATKVESVLAGLEVEFGILTGGGEAIATSLPSLIIEGEAPLAVDSILLQRGETAAASVDVVWTETTRWRTTIPVVDGTQQLRFLALDGDGNSSGSAELVVTGGATETFVRGDTDGSLSVNVTDPIRTLEALFGSAGLTCADAADSNDDGGVDLSDALYSLEYLFRRGPAPPAPFPLQGADPTADPLDCPGN